MKIFYAAMAGLTAWSVATAAELKQETLSAWDDYVKTANVCMLDRLRPENTFLWTDESPERARQVRAGTIVIAPIGEQNPKRVPNGLVHHWIGATFIPNSHLEDVFAVVRDYDRYKDYYRPGVLSSKAIRQEGADDRFSMMLMSKAALAKTALDSDYQSTYFQVDARRWYSVSSTTRVQEVEEYGQNGEHKLPQDQGHGYIWRLYSISRFMERDGGVQVEVEAMALSRDIPAAVRWMVDPIVRRVSKNSMVTTLRQTQEAVGSEVASASSPSWRMTAKTATYQK